MNRIVVVGVILLLIGVTPLISVARETPLQQDELVIQSMPFKGINFHNAFIQGSINIIFFIGWIDNFTQNGTKYSFHSYNLRSLEFYYGHSRREVSYEFFKGWWSHYYSGYNWKGIVRPNFICGILYDFD